MSATEASGQIRLGVVDNPIGVTVPTQAVLTLADALRSLERVSIEQTNEEIDAQDAEMLADQLEIAVSTNARGFFMDPSDAIVLHWALRRLAEEESGISEWAVALEQLLERS